jgi:hypothetical protein
VNRPVHIRAALSAAGHAIAEHVRLGDVFSRDELAPEIVAEVNYTLRSQGIVLKFSQGAMMPMSGGWKAVVPEPAPPPADVEVLELRLPPKRYHRCCRLLELKEEKIFSLGKNLYVRLVLDETMEDPR